MKNVKKLNNTSNASTIVSEFISVPTATIEEDIKIITEMPVKSEKTILLELYDVLKIRNIRSIGDLENQIANISE